jgi:DnaK suppressor protein
MNEKLRKQLGERLKEDRGHLEGEIAELRDYAIKATTYLEDENDAHGTHMADDASSLLERQTDMTLMQNLERELADVDSAITRMSAGSYGTCEVCGMAISEKRLLARPMATTCIECQRSIEGRQKREAASAQQG